MTYKLKVQENVTSNATTIEIHYQKLTHVRIEFKKSLNGKIDYTCKGQDHNLIID
jgi:hypothetical protein